ncbi:MAG: glycosyltransferase [Chloroflexi bacterium]|nr:glycosyltransferase [Chloroflexota bacterium]
MNSITYPGKLAVQQRVLPDYRAAFFDTLAGMCQGGVSVFAGAPGRGESIASAAGLRAARFTPAGNLHIGRVISPFYLCWQRGLLRWLEECQPEALIVEANPRYLSTRLAVGWMHARGRPVLGWGLGAPPLSGPLRALRASGRARFLAQFDGLIAYSQRGAEEYRAAGVPAGRVFVAPNAAAARRGAPPPLRPEGFAGPPCVLFVGRLQARKRVDLLLRACAGLPAAIQPELLIVGEGPAGAKLRALAQQIYPRARFSGAKRGAELAPLFAAADLFALPGTGGLAVQEAMAHGLPVIVAQGDGTQGDLVRPQNGWLLPADDLPALRATLADALCDPARLRAMGAESYRIVSEEINLERMAMSFIHALASL